MSWASVRTTARKELRSYFLSPVALIFLGVFLLVTLFIFFTYSKFFVRNLADVRPLFSWLPVLLIFLVSAVTMRQWSEEQKMGTLEVLMTLPLRTADLVLGKFLAGLALVGLALLLTLPLPITVATLGELDWGPVIGGYVAAMLLASTYMAIGLCVSARTDNQIVALMVTGLLCSLLYLVGSDSMANLFGTQGAEILRGVGSGSRFASIERGVLDLRDLAYYGTLTAFFLLLNVHFLELKRLEKQPSDGASRRPVMLLTVGLAAINVVAANLWLAPVTMARADLTADREYSISRVTEGMLAGLEEPLEIVGYFSEKTHPLLAPLVPRIRDFLKEYQIVGGSRVRVDFVDPSTSPETEEEINEQYGIKSVPFRVSGRHEESVVNSYFHLLVRYGDEYKVLQFDDLIEVHADDNDATVRLRNLEYDITSAIKKVTQGFQSVEAVLARSDQTVKLTAYVTPGSLPKEFQPVPERIKSVADALTDRSGGRLTFEQVDPSSDEALQDQLFRTYGFRPLAADLLGQERFYLHLLVQAGDRAEGVFPQGDLTEADLKSSVEASIQRLVPGFLKTVGLLTRDQPQQPNPFGGPPPQAADFRALERTLRADYQVQRVSLDDGVVPSGIDVLIVAKAGTLSDKQQFAIDQYLMRGGAVIVLAGAWEVKPGRAGLDTDRTDDKLLDLLEGYGFKVEQALVMDPRNSPFPIPVREQRGPYTFERIELMPYPFFPDIRQDGFNREHIALAGLPSLAMTWASPVRVTESTETLKTDVLVHSSNESWTISSPKIEPDFKLWPEGGFGRPEESKVERVPVVASAVGVFTSHFADKPSPLFGAETEKLKEITEVDRTGRTIKQSTPDARLVVVGSSEFVGDLVTQLASQIGGGPFRGNPILIRNLIDWALEDTDMLQIRSAGAFARTLRPMEAGARTTVELVNYALVLAALVAVMVIANTRRRMTRPIPLPPAKEVA